MLEQWGGVEGRKEERDNYSFREKMLEKETILNTVLYYPVNGT